MTWLIISILTTTLMLLILKGFQRYGVNTLHGIVVNYFVAVTTGLLLVGAPDINTYTNGASGTLWIPFVLGILFISIFLALARCAQVAGISVATVANKMSVVIPVLAAVLLYDETLGWIKISGIIIALVAVWMTSQKADGTSFDLRYLLLPIVIFIGGGVIDALVNHMQKLTRDVTMIPFMLTLAFASAFIVGVCTVTYRIIRFKEKVSGRSILGGIILGIPNYISIYAVTQALDSHIMESSELYPVNNMAIVVCSALGALIVFRERLSALNWTGIVLSVTAIALIAFA